MKDISTLQTAKLDQDKLGGLVSNTNEDYLKQLLGVGSSQIRSIRKGQRRPSADRLLRLMMLYDLKPADIITLG